MVGITAIFTLLFSLFAGLSSAFCRQCLGKQVITFNKSVNKQQAIDFFKSSLGDCATGNEYDILGVTQNNKTWTIQLKIWRYCGTGGSNFVGKGAHCINDVCVSQDYRVLTCWKTVNCHDECDFTACGV